MHALPVSGAEAANIGAAGDGCGGLRARRVELDALSGDELLQSGFWGTFRARLGWRPLAVAVSGAGVAGTVLLLCRRTPAGTFVYCPLGPGADLLAAMKPKTRYNVRLAERRGVVVREAGAAGLYGWYRLHRDMARRQGITRHSLRYFRELFLTADTYPGRRPRLLLLMAACEGEDVAGIVVSLFGRRARYLYGASSDRHRHAMPNYGLQWTAMRLAREAGCQTYDLFGIPRTADPALPMAGLYRMKTGFGGEIVHRAPAHDAVLNRPRHAAFRGAERARAWYLHRGRAPGHGG